MWSFFEWLSDEAPWYVIPSVIVLTFVFFGALMVTSLIALSAGLWIVPALIWIVTPAALIVTAYVKDRNND